MCVLILYEVGEKEELKMTQLFCLSTGIAREASLKIKIESDLFNIKMDSEATRIKDNLSGVSAAKTE